MPAIRTFLYTSTVLFIAQYAWVLSTEGTHAHWSHWLLGPALWRAFGG